VSGQRRPFGATEPSAAEVVRRAAAASESALESGRAELRVNVDGSESTYDYRFAGDDVGVVVSLRDGEAPGERRLVDGRLYWHVGDDPSTPWFHYNGETVGGENMTSDPRTMLTGLAPRAGFELAGDDTLDGVEVRRLRATTPEAVDGTELALGEASPTNGTLTGLDIWVDDDDVVRRIDLEITVTLDGFEVEALGDPVVLVPTERTGTELITASVRFRDIGVPNVIEVPPNVQELTLDDIRNPPPPPAG
jgi:hypothetical protein